MVASSSVERPRCNSSMQRVPRKRSRTQRRCSARSMDVSFREDEGRVRTDHAPANLGVIRRFVLGLLKRETSCRRGIETKRLECAASDEYREKALFNT